MCAHRRRLRLQKDFFRNDYLCLVISRRTRKWVKNGCTLRRAKVNPSVVSTHAALKRRRKLTTPLAFHMPFKSLYFVYCFFLHSYRCYTSVLPFSPNRLFLALHFCLAELKFSWRRIDNTFAPVVLPTTNTNRMLASSTIFRITIVIVHPPITLRAMLRIATVACRTNTSSGFEGLRGRRNKKGQWRGSMNARCLGRGLVVGLLRVWV